MESGASCYQHRTSNAYPTSLLIVKLVVQLDISLYMQDGVSISNPDPDRFDPGSLFTKATGVLPHDLVKSRSRAIGCYNYRIALKWNLTGISAALLSCSLSNFRVIGEVYTRISRLRDFTSSYGKKSACLVKRGPDGCRRASAVLV